MIQIKINVLRQGVLNTSEHDSDLLFNVPKVRLIQNYTNVVCDKFDNTIHVVFMLCVEKDIKKWGEM